MKKDAKRLEASNQNQRDDFLDIVKKLAKPNLDQAEAIEELEREINQPNFLKPILISL